MIGSQFDTQNHVGAMENGCDMTTREAVMMITHLPCIGNLRIEDCTRVPSKGPSFWQ